MTNKIIISNALKILLVFVLLFSLFSCASAACDASYVYSSIVISLSQYKACGNDTILVSASNLSECTGKNFTVTFEGIVTPLCTEQKIIGGQAVCYFNAPDIIGENKKVTVNVLGVASNYTLINLTSRPVFQQCYNAFDVPAWCNETCTDNPSVRKWQDVAAISLPLHFTFGVFEKASTSYTAATPVPIANNTMLHGLMNIKKDPNIKLLNCGAISTASCGCTTCQQSSSNPIWRPNTTSAWTAQYNAQRDVFGNSSWPGVYICNDAPPAGTPLNQKYAPPNIINKSNPTQVLVANAPEYATGTPSGCKGEESCAFETHNMTRYEYEWEASYDLITTAYSKTDYVPMYVGYGQMPVTAPVAGAAVAAAVSGGCVGDSLCYTEVPLCGDDVCDTLTGENCNTCPKDCFKPKDINNRNFNGDCNVGCSACPSSDTSWADARGCVIAYKTQEMDCDCDSQCKESGKPTMACARETEVQGTNLEPRGKCCPVGEVWNRNYDSGKGRCEIRRQVLLQKVEFEFADNTGRDYGFDHWFCCQNRDPIRWVKATFVFANTAIIKESVRVTAYFYQEQPGFLDNVYYQEYSKEFTIDSKPGTAEFYFDWSCVRTSIDGCYRTSSPVDKSTHQFNYSATDDQKVPYFVIHFTPLPALDVPTGYATGRLDDEYIYCDTTNMACATGNAPPSTSLVPQGFDITPLTNGPGEITGMCGGINRGCLPFLFYPVCCDAWDCDC